MLRECVKHEVLARIVLFSDNFFHLTTYIEMPNFEISSDAFATFRVRVILVWFVLLTIAVFVFVFVFVFTDAAGDTQNACGGILRQSLREDRFYVHAIAEFKTLFNQTRVTKGISIFGCLLVVSNCCLMFGRCVAFG